MNTCKIGFENSGSIKVGTSHSELNTSIGHYLRETNYTLIEVNHNHSNGNLISSWNKSQSISNFREGDVPYTATIEKYFLNVNFNTYSTKYGFSPYDSHGTLDQRILNGLIK